MLPGVMQTVTDGNDCMMQIKNQNACRWWIVTG